MHGSGNKQGSTTLVTRAVTLAYLLTCIHKCKWTDTYKQIVNVFDAYKETTEFL